jgi:hypothetical protein
MMSGNRYARDNEELQALLQGIDSNSRSGSQSGRLSDLFPILRRVFPRSTGFISYMDNIKNLQRFMKVGEVRIEVTVIIIIIVVTIAAVLVT